ncbi:hypothetical protein GCM10020370_32450 [Paenibacillus hodogayensis]
MYELTSAGEGVFLFVNGYPISEVFPTEGGSRGAMDDTKAYLNKLHETQAKDEKNRRTHGKGDPDRKLPGKQKER